MFHSGPDCNPLKEAEWPVVSCLDKALQGIDNQVSNQNSAHILGDMQLTTWELGHRAAAPSASRTET